MTMDCETLDRLLPELIDGFLPPSLETAASQHLATCDDCRLVVDETEAVTALYRTRGRIVIPTETRERLRRQLEKQL